VNYYLNPYLALQLSIDRLCEADQHRLTAIAAGARPPLSAPVRRPVARVLATLSRLAAIVVRRLAAIVVRRLDGSVADDLGRALTCMSLVSDREGSK
jgi:hypothetical protein